MAQIAPQQTPYVIVQQPIRSVDPFRTMTNEWHSGLCGCCEDVNQCNNNVLY
jgi:hypothetical protein